MTYKTEGKPDMTYLPAPALIALAKVLEFGGTKHGRGNYLTNPAVEDRELLAAILRHACELLAGRIMDDQPGGSGQTHYAAIMANAAMLEARRDAHAVATSKDLRG